MRVPDARDELTRDPPEAVRRELRREVGFGCPATGCGSPYLQYHHFDPPWNQEHHHDPARMIALCAEHHAKSAAWTVEDLRAMKQVPPDRPDIRGKFEWMRQGILAVIGGNFYFETPNMVVYRDTPIVIYRRDDQQRMLLNLRPLTTSRQPRLTLENNDWIIRGDPADARSPPNGSQLHVHYDNGDDIKIRFREWPTAHALGAVYPRALALGPMLRFPLVNAEITLKVGGTNINFGPTTTTLGSGAITGFISAYNANGLVL
jgi:hypothetical protein